MKKLILICMAAVLLLNFPVAGFQLDSATEYLAADLRGLNGWEEQETQNWKWKVEGGKRITSEGSSRWRSHSSVVAKEKKVLWDFRDTSDENDKEQEFSAAETIKVMNYLFGKDAKENLEITSRVTGSFTGANVEETLYYVGGCDDGEGFMAISTCSHAASWNAGWIAIFDNKDQPVRKISAALGYKVRYVLDLNQDGKEEILSLSGYSGMGETTTKGQIGQISGSDYETIFPLDDEFYFGTFELIKFATEENESDTCFALATVISYEPAVKGKFPAFSEEYYKSSKCDSSWVKVTKQQFIGDQ